MRAVTWIALFLCAADPAIALDETIGRAMFRRAWVPAPSSTPSNDGLGPLFNARSCTACHRNLDRMPVSLSADGTVVDPALVLRLSDRGGRSDPVYGRQLQTSGVAGVPPEGGVKVGSKGFRVHDLAYGPLGAKTRAGAFVAPALRGLGALQSVPDEAIVALAHDARARGGQGRVHWVADSNGERRIGRFGWKASRATLKAQVETAFLLDLGLSTEVHRSASGDCTSAQPACRAAPQGGDADSVEISDEIVSRVVTYLESITPPEPAMRDGKGATLFETTGCAACHRPVLPGQQGPVQAFTDLLLHDLGPAMDGGATEPGVAVTEWRTAPLWGLARTIENGAGLLHDGRASTIEEAVAFHGGEAGPSALRFRSLAPVERARLVAFLKSL